MAAGGGYFGAEVAADGVVEVVSVECVGEGSDLVGRGALEFVFGIGRVISDEVDVVEVGPGTACNEL